jgi:hypothetical protein
MNFVGLAFMKTNLKAIKELGMMTNEGFKAQVKELLDL